MRAGLCVVLVTACGRAPSSPVVDAPPETPPDAPPPHGLVEPPDPVSSPCAGTLGFPARPSMIAHDVRQLELADFDGDGVRGLVFRNGSVISDARLLPDGSFDAPAILAAPGGAFQLGGLDLPVGLGMVFGLGGQFPPSEVRIGVPGIGGGLSLVNSLFTSISVSHVELADFDGDGQRDLLAASAQGPAAVMRGIGSFDFGFAEFLQVAPFAEGTTYAVGDVTGDGRPDVVAVNQFGVHVTPTTGGAFGAFITTPLPNAQGFVLADVNHDGKLDVVAAISDPMISRVAVLPGNGDGTFGAPALQDLGAPSTIVAVVGHDLDHDGNQDFAVVRDKEGVAILFGRADGTLAPPLHVANAAARSVAFGDLDGDGFDDAIVGAQSSITTHLNTRTAALFEARGHVAFGAGTHEPRATAAMDLDGDGALDLVEVTANDGLVLVRRADGTGGFGPPAAIPLVINPSRVVVADFDNDQRSDLLIEGDGPMGQLQVLRALGDGTLTPATPVMTSGHDDLRVADFNGDGIRDLIVANGGVFPTYVGDVQLFPGLGDGSFGAPSTLWTGLGLEAIAVGDVDGDGVPDLVVAEYPFEERLAVVRGTGLGAVAPPVSTASRGRPRKHLALRDLDGDGRADLFGFRATSIAKLHNNGDGTFGALIESPMQTVEPRHAALADLDGDGHLDVTFTSGFLVGVARGRDGGGFELPRWFEGGAATVMPIDLDGDGRLDLVTEDGAGAGILRGRCL